MRCPRTAAPSLRLQLLLSISAIEQMRLTPRRLNISSSTLTMVRSTNAFAADYCVALVPALPASNGSPSTSVLGLTLRSTGRAGSYLRFRAHLVGAPVTLHVRPLPSLRNRTWPACPFFRREPAYPRHGTVVRSRACSPRRRSALSCSFGAPSRLSPAPPGLRARWSAAPSENR
jgi:hypothetical protein